MYWIFTYTSFELRVLRGIGSNPPPILHQTKNPVRKDWIWFGSIELNVYLGIDPSGYKTEKH